MRKILTLFLVVSISTLTLGQQALKESNVLGCSVGFINKVRLKWELALTDHWTTGMFGSAYYGFFPGLKAEPFLRAYVVNSFPEGLYLQGKAVIGRYRSSDKYEDDNGVWAHQEIRSTGGAFNVGYQFRLGPESGTVVDINLGVKLVSSEIINRKNNLQQMVDDVAFYTVGPGSVWDGLISVGFTF